MTGKKKMYKMKHFEEKLFRLFVLADHLQKGKLFNDYILLSDI